MIHLEIRLDLTGKDGATGANGKFQPKGNIAATPLGLPRNLSSVKHQHRNLTIR